MVSAKQLLVLLLWASVSHGETLLNDASIRLHTAGEVAAKRAELIQFIWNHGELPQFEAPIRTGAVSSPVPGLQNLARVDRLDISMNKGQQSSRAYVFFPQQSSGRLAVFHQGHQDTLAADGGFNTIQFFLSRGYIVAGLFMPCYGENKCKSKDHDKILKLKVSGSPLQFFLEPVLAVTSYLRRAYEIPTYTMIGISGGGWTTTWVAALDPALTLSIPVAGSLPLYLRTAADRGDLEQYFPDFYRRAGYPELYVLGSVGVGRRQMQILNKFDACCFRADRTLEYPAMVQSSLQSLQLGGEFGLAVDDSHSLHQISETALREIVAPAL